MICPSEDERETAAPRAGEGRRRKEPEESEGLEEASGTGGSVD